MCLFVSDLPRLWCIILNVVLGKKSLDTPGVEYMQLQINKVWYLAYLMYNVSVTYYYL